MALGMATKNVSSEKIISAVKFLDISEEEIKTYATLITLGYATIPMLSKIRNTEEENIKKTLITLKQRGWIEESNGVYSTVNPNEVINDEINKLKRELEKKITTLKSEALTELEDLFIQHNLKRVKDKRIRLRK